MPRGGQQRAVELADAHLADHGQLVTGHAAVVHLELDLTLRSLPEVFSQVLKGLAEPGLPRRQGGDSKLLHRCGLLRVRSAVKRLAAHDRGDGKQQHEQEWMAHLPNKPRTVGVLKAAYSVARMTPPLRRSKPSRQPEIAPRICGTEDGSAMGLMTHTSMPASA